MLFQRAKCPRAETKSHHFSFMKNMCGAIFNHVSQSHKIWWEGGSKACGLFSVKDSP